VRLLQVPEEEKWAAILPPLQNDEIDLEPEKEKKGRGRGEKGERSERRGPKAFSEKRRRGTLCLSSSLLLPLAVRAREEKKKGKKERYCRIGLRKGNEGTPFVSFFGRRGGR